MNLVEFFSRNYLEIIQHTLEHCVLAGTAVGAGILIGVPLGLIGTRKPKMGKAIIGFANIVQTIPSLALFGFLIPIPLIGGIGQRTAIVALTLYSLLPIIRNTYTGVKAVDPAITEAGRGMGMTDRQLLFQVELPLAWGFIMAGIRVAAVFSVGIATIAAAIGAGGLGVFIFRGVSMVNNEMIMAGAIPAVLLVLLTDFVLVSVEYRLTRRVRKTESADEI